MTDETAQRVNELLADPATGEWGKFSLGVICGGAHGDGREPASAELERAARVRCCDELRALYRDAFGRELPL